MVTGWLGCMQANIRGSRWSGERADRPGKVVPQRGGHVPDFRKPPRSKCERLITALCALCSSVKWRHSPRHCRADRICRAGAFNTPVGPLLVQGHRMPDHLETMRQEVMQTEKASFFKLHNLSGDRCCPPFGHVMCQEVEAEKSHMLSLTADCRWRVSWPELRLLDTVASQADQWHPMLYFCLACLL